MGSSNGCLDPSGFPDDPGDSPTTRLGGVLKPLHQIAGAKGVAGPASGDANQSKCDASNQTRKANMLWMDIAPVGVDGMNPCKILGYNTWCEVDFACAQ